MDRERLGSWRTPAVAACVPRIRRELLRHIKGRQFDDIAVSLAVTEAVANVVLHAYPAHAGQVAVTAELVGTDLVVVVSDTGVGRRGFGSTTSAGLGHGLGVIRGLCARATVAPTGAGTAVTMRFTPDA
jgi:anti-sigma regulatory factor (Ser/Thr protein kinase)